MSKLDPKDGKNFESKAFERHCQSSGDMDSIHGMSNFQITTQEAQTLGFYADTGQGKGGQGGPGTGKFVLNTPGMALEVLGQGRYDISSQSLNSVWLVKSEQPILLEHLPLLKGIESFAIPFRVTSRNRNLKIALDVPELFRLLVK